MSAVQVLLIGPPGSGQRTQTLCLAGCLGVTPVSGTDAASEHQILDALQAAVSAGGFVLSGYPRSLTDAVALDAMLAERGAPLDAVIVLNVSPHLRLFRLARDSSTDGPRSPIADDVERRAQLSVHQSTYTTRTVPVLEHYRSRNLLDAVDGMGSVTGVTLRIAASLHARRHAQLFPQVVNG